MTFCDFCCDWCNLKKVNVKLEIEHGPPPTIDVLDLCEECRKELESRIKDGIASMVQSDVRKSCPSLTPDQARQVEAWANRRKSGDK